MYKQVTLRKKNIHKTVWIPENFAHKGKFLKIKGDDGWEVIFVGQIRLSHEYIEEHERDYKHQREVSDI